MTSLLNVFIKFIVSPILTIIFLFYFVTMFNFMILYIKGHRPIKYMGSNYEKHWFIKLFYDFPKQLANELMFTDPNKFRPSGTVLFCGGQGSGKTIGMVYYLQKLQKQYPKMIAYANIWIKDTSLFNGWKDMIDNNNGEDGVVFCIDELPIWFNMKDSSSFPPEMLQDINQQRKQRKHTIATAQVFGQVAKPIRAVPDTIFLPYTFFKVLTIVLVTRPQYWNTEKMQFKKFHISKTWFFVHTKELRESYDTFERVSRASRDGFEPNKFLEQGDRFAVPCDKN